MATVIVKAHKDTAVAMEGATAAAMAVAAPAEATEATEATARGVGDLDLDMVRIPILLRVLRQPQALLAREVRLSRTTARNGHSTFSKTLNMLPTTMLNSSKLLLLLGHPVIKPRHLHQAVLLVLAIVQ